MRSLRFDFWIPSLNLAIEYDGLQHSGGAKWFTSETSERDSVKDSFCQENGIDLIRIPHTCRTVKQIRKYLEEERSTTRVAGLVRCKQLAAEVRGTPPRKGG